MGKKESAGASGTGRGLAKAKAGSAKKVRGSVGDADASRPSAPASHCSACLKKADRITEWGATDARGAPVGNACQACQQKHQQFFGYMTWERYSVFVKSEAWALVAWAWRARAEWARAE